MDSNRPTANGAPSRAKAAGIVLVLSSALTVAAIAHHPTITRATSRSDVLAQVVRFAPLDRAVHAAVIVAACGLLFGLVAFALRRGVRDAGVLAGLIAYAVGTGPAIAAALIDGFLIPAIAARFASADPQTVRTALVLLTVCAAAIQIATKTWLLASSTAIALWSFGLVRQRGIVRAAGAGGIAATVLALAVVAFTGNFDPHTLGVVVLAQALWYVAIGALLIRGEL
ncbi:MAG TPA: hypothetical protein VK669_13000 [Candidatus Limnocylindrales bacterium]|nr:hypothetical protein [Candidatus Limnocylindrales bacterium]